MDQLGEMGRHVLHAGPSGRFSNVLFGSQRRRNMGSAPLVALVSTEVVTWDSRRSAFLRATEGLDDTTFSLSAVFLKRPPSLSLGRVGERLLF